MSSGSLMNKYWQYLKYLLRHKWYVLKVCWRHDLYWRGITHDLSKFRPDEFIPYANYFYGGGETVGRDETGYYKPTDTGDKDFDMAWLKHQKRNDHHWQWWVLPEDDGGMKVLKMSGRAAFEMICDWVGAGKVQGHGDNVIHWYEEHKDRIRLHPITRRWVEHILEKYFRCDT